MFKYCKKTNFTLLSNSFYLHIFYLLNTIVLKFFYPSKQLDVAYPVSIKLTAS